MSWVEVDGAGWRWVQGLVIPTFQYRSNQRCSVKKLFLEISQNSQKNTCARVLFLIKSQTEACNFIKKETLTKVFSCEFREISKITFPYRKFLVTASVVNKIFHKMRNDFCFWYLIKTFTLRSFLFLRSPLKEEL